MKNEINNSWTQTHVKPWHDNSAPKGAQGAHVAGTLRALEAHVKPVGARLQL